MDRTKLEILNELGFYNGRLISGSKSTYRKKLPDNLVLFNANIFTEKFGKIFYGDIDLTKDQSALKYISLELNETLYVLNEMDGRFGNENRSDFKNVAIWNTETGLSEEYKNYFCEDLKRIIK